MRSLLFLIGWVVFATSLTAQTGPDLQIVYLEITEEGQPQPEKRPMTLRGGDMVDLRFDVYNVPVRNGNPTGSAVGYRVDVYLSQDGQIHEDASLGAERGNMNWTFIQSGGLRPGDTHSYHYTVHVPGNLPGSYFLTAEVTVTDGPADVYDPNNIYEPNETVTLTILPVNYPWTDGVSTTPGGSTGDGVSDHPSISDDNRYVAFASEATDLVPGVELQAGQRNIFVRDMHTGEIRWISTAMGGGAQPDGDSDHPQISGNGRYVVFESDATNLVTGDTNAWSDIFLHDLDTRRTIRISLPDSSAPGYNVENPQANGSSYLPTISADGKYVVFESSATNLVSQQVQQHRDIYLHEVNWENPRDGRTLLISKGIDGGGSNDVSNVPFINAAGTRVVYETMATNIVSEGGNNFRQIIAYDIERDENTLISRGLDGGLANEQSESPALNATGEFAVFASFADNLMHHPLVGWIMLDSELDPLPGDSLELSDGDQTVVFEFTDGTDLVIPDSIGVPLGGPDFSKEAEGLIVLTENPESGATITLDDGEESATFQFVGGDDDPGENIPVSINGDSVAATRRNLVGAIQERGLSLDVFIDGTLIRVYNPNRGGIYNTPILASGLGDENSVFGMRYGRDLVDETMENLIAAIYEAGLDFVAIDDTPYGFRRDIYPTPVISLTHRDPARRLDDNGIVASGSNFFAFGLTPFSSRYRDIYLYDFNTGDIEMVSVNRSGVQGAGGNEESTDPVMNGDGNIVVFQSLANDLLPPLRVRSDGYVFSNPLIWGYSHLVAGAATYYRDRSEPTILAEFGLAPETKGVNTRASVNRFGFEPVYVIGAPQVPATLSSAVSDDGRFILFASDAHNNLGLIHGPTNLISPDQNGMRDIVYHDRRTPGVPPDQIGNPPSVSIVSPTGDVTVSTGARLPVTASAFDPDGTVEKIEIYSNGQLILEEENPGSHLTGIWQVPNFPGTYLVYAAATDDHGNRTVSESVAVTVETATGPLPFAPEFSISSPVVRRGQSVMMLATPSPEGPEVTSAQFYANGQLIGTAEGEPFSFSWQPTSTGTYNIHALVTDAAGNTAPSEVLRLTVTGVQGNPPTVSVISPEEGFVLTDRSEWPLAAIAGDSDGNVDSVEFFLNGAAIGQAQQETYGSVWRLNYDFTGRRSGLYQLVAVARDDQGNVSASSPVSVQINPAFSSAPFDVRLNISPNKTVFSYDEMVHLTVTARHDEDTIRNVTFFVSGSQAINEEENPNPDTTEPFSITRHLNIVGTHTFYAVARDGEGNSTLSNEITVTVMPAASEATLEIVSPDNGDTFTVGMPVPIRINARAAEGVVTRVEILINGAPIGEGGAILTSPPYRYDWVPVAPGNYIISARAMNTLGHQWSSDGVSVTVNPTGVVPGNPADPTNRIGFVIQMFADLLGRDPTVVELQQTVNALESGEITRGQLVTYLLDHPDFTLTRWVVAAYMTVLKQAPSYDRLIEGILILRGGEGEDPPGGGDDEEGGSLRPGIPSRLPALVSAILNGEEFWWEYIRTNRVGYDETGRQVDMEHLLDLVHNGQGTHKVKQRRLLDMQRDGRAVYLANLTDSRLSDSRRDVSRVALILLLLERDTTLAEAGMLPRDLNQAAEFILSSPAFIAKHDGPVSFFVLRERLEGEEVSLFGSRDPVSGMYVKESDWFGLLNDQYYDYISETGWIKHAEHDWVYFAYNSYTPNGAWMWDHIQQEWLWTSADIYPLIFSDRQNVWLYYEEGGTPSLREFRIHNGNAWSGVRRVGQ